MSGEGRIHTPALGSEHSATAAHSPSTAHFLQRAPNTGPSGTPQSCTLPSLPSLCPFCLSFFLLHPSPGPPQLTVGIWTSHLPSSSQPQRLQHSQDPLEGCILLQLMMVLSCHPICRAAISVLPFKLVLGRPWLRGLLLIGVVTGPGGDLCPQDAQHQGSSLRLPWRLNKHFL